MRLVLPLLLALASLALLGSAQAADSASGSVVRDMSAAGESAVAAQRSSHAPQSGARPSDLEQQQLERMQRLQRRIPRLARIGVPSCPSFPWCERIPMPPPVNLSPPDVPLPFLNVPQAAMAAGAASDSSASASAAADASAAAL